MPELSGKGREEKGDRYRMSCLAQSNFGMMWHACASRGRAADEGYSLFISALPINNPMFHPTFQV
jgi:hypothetical protein